MLGLLADVNVEGHVHHLRQVLEKLDLWSILAQLDIDFALFPDLRLPRDLDDRSIWNRCQQDGWVLFTENRNDNDANSLESTIADSWRNGHLPILTLANKGRFENESDYRERVATEVAEFLFGIAHGEYRDRPRIYVPR